MYYTCKKCKFASKNKETFIRHMKTKRHEKNVAVFDKKYPFIKYKDTASQYAKLIIEDPNFDTNLLQPNESKSPVVDIESDDEDESFDEVNINIEDDLYNENIDNNENVQNSESDVDEPNQNTDNIYNVDSDITDTDDEKNQDKKKVSDNDEDEIHDFKRIIVYLHNKLEDHDRIFAEYKTQMESDKRELNKRLHELQRIVRMLTVRVNHIECETPEQVKSINSSSNSYEKPENTVNNYIHNHISLNVSGNEINKYTLQDYAKMYSTYEKTLEHHKHEVYESNESHLAYIEIPGIDNFLVVHCKDDTWEVKPKHQLNEHKYKDNIMQITQWMDHMKFDGLDHVESLRVYISTPCESDNEFVAGVKSKLNQIHESDFKKRAQQLFPRKYGKKSKEKKEELINEIET